MSWISNSQPVSFRITHPDIAETFYKLPQSIPRVVTCLLASLRALLQSLLLEKHKPKHFLSPFLLEFQWTLLWISSSVPRQDSSGIEGGRYYGRSMEMRTKKPNLWPLVKSTRTWTLSQLSASSLNTLFNWSQRLISWFSSKLTSHTFSVSFDGRSSFSYLYLLEKSKLRFQNPSLGYLNSLCGFIQSYVLNTINK